MHKASLTAVLTAVALGGALTTACGKADIAKPDVALEVQNGEEGIVKQRQDAQLPFHSVLNWEFRQVPLPPGRCTGPLPPGLSYLWMTELSGSAESTHLGTGTIDGSICLYGQLTNPNAPPPDNGIPMGWEEGRIVLTAANGDRLNLTARSTGFTAPPGTPGFQFIEEVRFVDGGTGRFEFADGEAIGYVDPIAQTAVYDGWIRYGRAE